MTDFFASLGLTAEQKATRRHGIGGSDACIIMGGNPDKLIRLWREKRDEAEPEDLSRILAVVMGSYTEALNAAWFERETGDEVVERQRSVTHPDLPHMRCTLDGVVIDAFGGEAVFEAKHIGAHIAFEDAFARYAPQLAHNCLCRQVSRAYLSVIRGNGEWRVLEFAADEQYAAALIKAEQQFWDCVQSGEPPVPLPAPPAPKPVSVKVYDMTGRNEWAAAAADFADTRDAAQRHEASRDTLKSLVPADASKAQGHGIELRRDKRGALRFYTGETANA